MSFIQSLGWIIIGASVMWLVVAHFETYFESYRTQKNHTAWTLSLLIYPIIGILLVIFG